MSKRRVALMFAQTLSTDALEGRVGFSIVGFDGRSREGCHGTRVVTTLFLEVLVLAGSLQCGKPGLSRHLKMGCVPGKSG